MILAMSRDCQKPCQLHKIAKDRAIVDSYSSVQQSYSKDNNAKYLANRWVLFTIIDKFADSVDNRFANSRAMRPEGARDGSARKRGGGVRGGAAEPHPNSKCIL